MTFSIVARDPATRQLGVAVATCALAVGRAAPWARAGVGAVATQALSQRGYGPRLLDRLAAGDAAGRRPRPAAGRGRGRRPAAGRGRRHGRRAGRLDRGRLPVRLRAPDRRRHGRAGQHAGVPLGRPVGRRGVRRGVRRRDRRPRRPAGGGAAGRRRGRRRPARAPVGRADRGVRAPGTTRRPGRACWWTCGSTTPPTRSASCERLLRLQRAYETGDYELLAPGGARRGYGSCTGRWPRPPAATGTAPGTRCVRCGSAPAGRAGCAGCGSTAGCPPPRSSCRY